MTPFHGVNHLYHVGAGEKEDVRFLLFRKSLHQTLIKIVVFRTKRYLPRKFTWTREGRAYNHPIKKSMETLGSLIGSIKESFSLLYTQDDTSYERLDKL